MIFPYLNSVGISFLSATLILLYLNFPSTIYGNADSGSWQNLLLFLSGNADRIRSPSIQKFAREPVYEHYRTVQSKRWKDYEKGTLLPLQNWCQKNLPPDTKKSSGSVVYPFSGPDIGNLFYCFPNKKKYILMGLESPGIPARLEKKSSSEKARGILTITQAMRSNLEENFYYTNEMKGNISKNPIFTGTSHIILTYLGKMGWKVTGISFYKIDYNGAKVAIEEKDIKPNDWHSIQFKLVDPKGNPKILEYNQVDLADSRYLGKNSGVFLYLKNLGSYTVFLKAASFLLHLRNYRTLKDELMDRGDTIVMDDSGIPYQDLKKNYNVRIFGEYKTMYYLFEEKFQPDLSQRFQREKPPKIPFRFGYGPETKILIGTKKNP